MAAIKRGHDRLHCCVPFCARTTGQTEFDEWVCGIHWSTVRADLRRLYAFRKRRLKRNGPEYRIKVDRVWDMCKRDAIERAVGL